MRPGKNLTGIALIMGLSVFSYFIAYVIRIVLARHLGPKDYGLFYAIFTLIMMFLFLRDLGLDQALTRFIARHKAKEEYDEIKSCITVAVGIQLFVSFIVAVTFFLLSDWLAMNYFKDYRAAIALKIMAFYIVSSVIFSLTRGFFSGFKKFGWYSVIDPLKNVVTLGLIGLFIWLGKDFTAPIFAYSMVEFFMIGIFVWPMLKTFPYFKYRNVELKQTAKTMLVFGVPLVAAGAGNRIISFFDVLMLTYYGTLTEVGIYNISLPFAMSMLFISSAVTAVSLPILTESWTKGLFDKFRKTLRKIKIYAGLLSVFSALVATVLSTILIGVLFGTEYLGAVPSFIILVWGMVFFIIGSINYSALGAIDNTKPVAKITLMAAGLNIILNLLFIPKFGINGAAIATTISYFLIFFLSEIKIRRLINADHSNIANAQ